jgi:HAD superfamily hydrolase (TIGR01548 family)
VAKKRPPIVIFDLDGVLVDVRASYYRAVVETVRRFTGQRVAMGEIQRWKNRPGYNDDWKLTYDWIRSLGGRARYTQVKRAFQGLYRGRRFDGFITREKWLLERADLARLARRAELAIFTSRPRDEARHTLAKAGMDRYFRRLVALEDVARPKPNPEGLRKILRGRDPRAALYLGDNVDDALAARRAGIAFLAVLPRRSRARRLCGPRLAALGARAILGRAKEVERWLG